MNTTEHAFPLPQTVTHQLEEIQDELKHQPILVRARDHIRANPWPHVLGAAMVGVIIGIFLARR
jgi:ElaB/YqjD/DUF883 family membrane-anchored ribosome-binding protein